MSDSQKPFQIHCVGLSHDTAPVAVREQATLGATNLAAALAYASSHFAELVIVSTCNRVEFYTVGPSYRAVCDFIAERCGLSARTLEPYLFHHSGMAAAEHLFGVAAGLDSMMLGEPQILGQVTGAFETAVAHKSIGPVLTTLFRAAIRVGKRARSETAISRNSLSISAAAMQLTAAHVGDLASKHVLVVGAGEMAQLALKNLQRRGVKQLAITNRNEERAARLASQLCGTAVSLSNLVDALHKSDVVVCATSAPGAIITRPMVAAAMRGREARPLTLTDLAVPRDVEPAVASLPQVTLFDVDDLRAQVDEGMAERQREVPKVAAIVAAELRRFGRQQREAAVRPLITDLRRQAETIRQRELARTLRHLPEDIDEKVLCQLEQLSQSLVKKLLHVPTARLREEASGGCADSHVAMLRYLFDLEEPF